MNHYVYRVEDLETGEFYIGSRSTELLPEEDSKYKGSQYYWKLTKDQKDKLEKTIIKSDFSSRTEAVLFEGILIKENFNDPLNRNGTIPDGKYHTKGKAIVKDNDGNILCVDINDERYLNGELVSINKGRKFTEEHKKKISWLGKSHTQESREKMSKSQKGKERNHRTRAKILIQMDLNMNFIREWNSLSEAAKFYNASCGSLFTGINHPEKTRLGCKWKWKE
jgi:hypothetical protein